MFNMEKNHKLNYSNSVNNSFIETNVFTVISKSVLYTNTICKSFQSDNSFLERINNAMEEIIIEEETQKNVMQTPHRRFINDKDVINMISDFTLD